MPTIIHDRRQIAYEMAGSGPAVVLLPPGASPAAAWRRVTERLGERYQCLAVNPAGYPGTDRFEADRPMTMKDEAEAVAAIIEPLDGPAHLVGHSYGGGVALELVLMHPSRFATLTLIEPAVYTLLAPAGESALAADVEGVNRRYIEMVGAGEHEPALALYIDYYNGGSGAWERLPQTAQARLLDIAQTIATALAANHLSDIALDDLATIAVPTLVVAGAVTDRVHARLAEIIAAAIPGTRFERVEGAGHMVSLTHPEETAALIAGHAGQG